MENSREGNERIQFHTNLSYSKARNYAERSIRNRKKIIKQFHPHSQQKLSLFRDECQTILLLVQTTLNSTPYHITSLISPEFIINPRAQVGDFVLPQREENSTTQETMKSLEEALQDVRLANLEEHDLLQ